ncbi:MAG: hypothetical protein IT365_08365 [Candidatus Hydrogenedentes bacterium]|nr:hypothetical protein [Candidatus Hydrogenedentota bacterium]
MKSARTTWAIALVVAAVALTLWAQPRFRAAQRNALCVQNLDLIGAALSIYVNESEHEVFPLLPSVPGRVMFDSAAIYPKYLPDTTCFVSPFHPDYARLLARDIDPASRINDNSYWYLSYIFANERSALARIDEYKRLLPERRAPDDVDVLWPEYQDDFEARKEEARRYEEEALAAARAEWIAAGQPGEFQGLRARKLGGAMPLPHEQHLYKALRMGVERFLITEISNPASSVMIQSHSPILIERPELHGDGGHVLFMDGHVEFVPFPGPFPMTGKFIDGLRSLDRVN